MASSWKKDPFNTLRPRQNGCHFADDSFRCIFLNENIWIPIKISLKFVPKCPINTIPSLVQIMVWRRPGAKPLSEPMIVSLLTHICVTRPQWVKSFQALLLNSLHLISLEPCSTPPALCHQLFMVWPSTDYRRSYLYIRAMMAFKSYVLGVKQAVNEMIALTNDSLSWQTAISGTSL